MPPDGHLSAEQLVRVAARDLPADERRVALAHLEQCTDCGDRLAAVLLLQQGAGAPQRGWLALAAAAALVLLAGAWIILPPTADEPPPMSPARRALVERFAAYARSDNLEPMYYDFVLEIDYPDVVRVSPDQHRSRARAAIIELRDGRYQEAIDQLAALYAEHPDFDSVAGWLGMAMYLSGETDPLVGGLLERGAQSSIDPLQRMTTWYGAQYLLRTGRPEEAVAKLRELAPIPVTLGRMAKAQLEEMPLTDLGLGGDGEEIVRTCGRPRRVAASDARAA